MNTMSTSQLWRIEARHRDRTPPFNAMPPFELRAASEALALERLAQLRPDLEILAIERRPATSPWAPSAA
jgi:hypothetical protein